VNAQIGSNNQEIISVILVEDEPLFRELLQRILGLDTRIHVLATSDNGDEAVRLARELRPDVVLMDLELKDGFTGFKAALRIKRERIETGIVILTSHEGHGLISKLPAEASQGWSYLLKKTVSDLQTLVLTITGTKNGLVILDPAIVASLNRMKSTKLSGLTPRQGEVLELVALGYNNTAIADRLNISTNSVNTHLNATYRKLGIRKDLEAHPRVKACIRYLEFSKY